MSRSKKILTYVVIMFVALVCALNYHLFVFPNQFAPAGLNGICTMVQYLSGISVGYLSLIINIPLALLVYFMVSKPLAIRSMVYVITSSVALVLLEYVDLTPFQYATESGTSKILGPLAAGVIYGYCYRLLVQCSAYSGGTDFIAALIHKYKPEKSTIFIIFGLNSAVALISYFVYGYQIEPVILCILYCFTSSTISDKLTKSGRSAIRFEIVTDHPRQIADEIINKLHHSATLIPGKGMYMGKEKNILICVVNRSQMTSLSRIVAKYPDTFAIMSSVNEVVGNFKKIDSKGKLEVELLDSADSNSL